MAVAFDAVGPSSSGTAAAAAGTLSWSHTCGASATALFVWVNCDGDSGPTCTVKYNSIAMTQVGTTHTTANGFVFLFYLANPTTGSALTVAVTTTGGGLDGVIAGSVSYSGTTGHGTAVTALAKTVTVNSTAASSLVIGGFAAGANITATTSPANQRWLDNFKGSGGGDTGNATQADQAAGGNITMGWSTTATTFAAMAIELQGAASTTAVPNIFVPKLHIRQRRPQPAIVFKGKITPVAVPLTVVSQPVRSLSWHRRGVSKFFKGPVTPVPVPPIIVSKPHRARTGRVQVQQGPINPVRPPPVEVISTHRPRPGRIIYLRGVTPAPVVPAAKVTVVTPAHVRHRGTSLFLKGPVNPVPVPPIIVSPPHRARVGRSQIHQGPVNPVRVAPVTVVTPTHTRRRGAVRVFQGPLPVAAPSNPPAPIFVSKPVPRRRGRIVLLTPGEITSGYGSGDYGSGPYGLAALPGPIIVSLPRRARTGRSLVTTGLTPPPPFVNLPCWGLGIDNPPPPSITSQIAQASTDAARPLRLVQLFDDMIGGDGQPFPTSQATEVSNNGAIPMLVTQPDPSIQNVITGADDTIMTTWATGAAAYGLPVVWRPWRELNGGTYQWAYGYATSPPTQAQQIQAWRRAYEIIKPIAPNVIFVWNVADEGDAGFAASYPGDGYVDWLSFDGYAKSSNNIANIGWSATHVCYNTLAGLGSGTKPIMIAEFAADLSSFANDAARASWITTTFNYITNTQTRVTCVVWFNGTGYPSATYAFDNSGYPLSQAAFDAAIVAYCGASVPQIQVVTPTHTRRRGFSFFAKGIITPPVPGYILVSPPHRAKTGRIQVHQGPVNPVRVPLSVVSKPPRPRRGRVLVIQGPVPAVIPALPPPPIVSKPHRGRRGVSLFLKGPVNPVPVPPIQVVATHRLRTGRIRLFQGPVPAVIPALPPPPIVSRPHRARRGFCLYIKGPVNSVPIPTTIVSKPPRPRPGRVICLRGPVPTYPAPPPIVSKPHRARRGCSLYIRGPVNPVPVADIKIVQLYPPRRRATVRFLRGLVPTIGIGSLTATTTVENVLTATVTVENILTAIEEQGLVGAGMYGEGVYGYGDYGVGADTATLTATSQAENILTATDAALNRLTEGDI